MGGVMALRFGRPPAGPTDPLFSSVVFLSGFEGADASTSFTDESSFARTITAVSGAQVDTAQFKYGASSLLLNGSSDAITCVDSTDFEFGSGQYTVECFVRFNSVSDCVFVGHSNSSGIGWQLRRSSGALVLTADNGAGTVGVTWTPSANTWYHVCADRDGSGVTRTYVDGVFKEKATGTNAMGNPAALLAIGKSSWTSALYLNGWMDEVRITKGAARYASDGGFTPPTAAFPRS